MTAPKISVAGYVRVSSPRQVKEGESLEDQKRLVKKYCKLNDYSLYKIYEDAGVSGSKEDRPALEEMKRDADRGLFNRIVFSALDRFGRSAEDTLSNYKFFERRKGITLYAIKEGIDTSTPVGRLTRTILAAIAEMEKDRIRERVIVGLVARANGGQPIGKVSFGYRWDKEKKAFILNPDEAEIYKTIVHSKKA